MEKSYTGNIARLYIIKCAKWFMLVMPIIVLFYQDNGLNLQEIFLLKAVYSVSIVLFEIPSGYFSDVWGRKKTLLLGTILGAAGYFTYSLSHHFIAFLLAEILLGIGQSFISGSDSAMLYDSLYAEKKSDQYLKLEGRVTSIGNFAEALAGILGGLLAAYSIRYPFYGQTLVAFLGVPAALTLIEPPTEKTGIKPGLRDILSVVHDALFQNRALRRAILLSSLIGTATLTMAWFAQPYLIETNLPVSWFGIIWTTLNLVAGVTSIYAHRIEKKFGQIQTVLIILLFISGIYILLSQIVSLWAISLLLIFYLVRGVATPVLKNYINRLTTSANRATVLSVRSFVIRILFAIIGPLLGWSSDRLSLGPALLIAGLIFLLSGLIIIFPLIAKKNK